VNAKLFQKYLNRDGGCVHCGEIETAVPHHRINRGMGGSLERDVPANIISVCSMLNFQMESDARAAKKAKEYGWKLESWQNPYEVPIFNRNDNQWFLLDNSFRTFPVNPPSVTSAGK
jgi:hypothetical protein